MDKNITIYSTPTCHFCHMAKEFLSQHDVPFTDVDVSADPDKRAEMIEKSGQMGVPQIYVGDEFILGFDRARLAALAGIEA